MFRPMFKRWAVTVLLGAGLFGGTLTLVTQPAKAAQVQAVRQYALSPGAQQIQYTLLISLPRYLQPLVLNAIQSLGPERAEAQLSQLTGVSAGYLRAYYQVVMQVLQLLPPQYHQAFINGLFQVSPDEERFAIQVLNTAVEVERMNGETLRIALENLRRMGEGRIRALGPYWWPEYPLWW